MPNQDVPVNVTAVKNDTVEIPLDKVTFVNGTSHAGSANEPEFTIHPLTCSLTITKDMATGSALFDENDSFIFTVTGSGNTYANAVDLKVVINGTGTTKIVGLPIGTYTVTESDGPTGWSWRYTASGEGDVTLGKTSETDDGSITITNTLTINKWLSGSSYAVNTWNGSGITAKGILAAIAKLVKGV